VDTCTWIADYEHWVASECGVAYRAVTITQWAAVSIVDARSVVDTWRQLAQNVDAEMNGCLSSLPEGMLAPIHW
jgi:hypothetical protein